MKIWPGSPYPLGANWDGSGVNFALFSGNATGVELCLFDTESPRRETKRIPIKEQPTKFGMFICRKRGRDSYTAVAIP
jgi:isoamylase